METLNLERLSPKAKHLCLPLILIPYSWGQVVEDLKDKLLRKISGWKAKLLSQAGHTALIKYVTAAVPLLPPQFLSNVSQLVLATG